MSTYRFGHRLIALISLLLLLSAGLLAAQAAAPLHTERAAVRLVIGENPVYLPLALKIIPTVRIDSAATTGHTDADGHEWSADTGFVDGTAGANNGLPITNTTDQLTYQTERFKLTGYALPVANGPYTVTLHFAENFYSAPNKRVFSVNVEGTPINNLDVFAEAGGAQKALLKTVSVTVTDGTLNIGFTPALGETMIDGLEVIPK